MSEPHILAIDPGPKESAWVVLEGAAVTAGMALNDALVSRLREYWKADLLAVEMIASYGMAVGEEVFTTCFWTGRFVEAWAGPFKLVPRLEVKMCLCHDSRARDGNIRQALIDRFGGDSVALAKPRRCEACGGRGTEKAFASCEDCAGRGKVMSAARGLKNCPACKGRARVPITPPCLKCLRTGRVGADGPLTGISGHLWSALAIAVTVRERSR
jgi:hypothetical protein